MSPNGNTRQQKSPKRAMSTWRASGNLGRLPPQADPGVPGRTDQSPRAPHRRSRLRAPRRPCRITGRRCWHQPASTSPADRAMSTPPRVAPVSDRGRGRCPAVHGRRQPSAVSHPWLKRGLTAALRESEGDSVQVAIGEHSLASGLEGDRCPHRPSARVSSRALLIHRLNIE